MGEPFHFISSPLSYSSKYLSISPTTKRIGDNKISGAIWWLPIFHLSAIQVSTFPYHPLPKESELKKFQAPFGGYPFSPFNQFATDFNPKRSPFLQYEDRSN
jgi:hypothetical protein